MQSLCGGQNKLYTLKIWKNKKSAKTFALWRLVKAACWAGGKKESTRRVWALSFDGQVIWHSAGTASRAHFSTYQLVQLR